MIFNLDLEKGNRVHQHDEQPILQKFKLLYSSHPITRFAFAGILCHIFHKAI